MASFLRCRSWLVGQADQLFLLLGPGMHVAKPTASSNLGDPECESAQKSSLAKGQSYTPGQS